MKEKTLLASGEVPAPPPAPESPPGDDHPETLWGRFEIEAELGSGGMGVVYRCKDTTLGGEIVAIKVLRNELFGDPDARARLRDEVQIARSLRHPRLVPVFDYFEDERYAGFAMEFLRGITLEDLMADPALGSKVPSELLGMHLSLVSEIAEQLAEAVTYLHEQRKLVHRDIKPSNVMVDGLDAPAAARLGRYGGLSVTLLDFGIAHAAEGDRRTRVGASGTMGYLAPELLDGSGEPSAASDMFAYGCLVYQALTGQPPSYLLPPPSTLIEGLPAVVDDPIRACFDVPVRRQADPRNVSRALRAGEAEICGRGRAPDGEPPGEDKPGPTEMRPSPMRDEDPPESPTAAGGLTEDARDRRIEGGAESQVPAERQPESHAGLYRSLLVTAGGWVVLSMALAGAGFLDYNIVRVAAPVGCGLIGLGAGLLWMPAKRASRWGAGAGLALLYGGVGWLVADTRPSLDWAEGGSLTVWWGLFRSLLTPLPWFVATQGLLHLQIWRRLAPPESTTERGAASRPLDAATYLGWICGSLTIWWVLALALKYPLRGDLEYVTDAWLGNRHWDWVGTTVTGLFAGLVVRRRHGHRYRWAPLVLPATLLVAVVAFRLAEDVLPGWQYTWVRWRALWDLTHAMVTFSGFSPVNSYLPGFALSTTCLALFALTSQARFRSKRRPPLPRRSVLAWTSAATYVAILVLVLLAGSVINLAGGADGFYGFGAAEGPGLSALGQLQIALVGLLGTGAAATIWSAMSVLARNSDHPWRDTLITWAVFLAVGVAFFLPRSAAFSPRDLWAGLKVAGIAVFALSTISGVTGMPWSGLSRGPGKND